MLSYQTYLVSLPRTFTISLAQVFSRPLSTQVPQGTLLSHLTRRLEQLKQAFGALWLFLAPAIEARAVVLLSALVRPHIDSEKNQ